MHCAAGAAYTALSRARRYDDIYACGNLAAAVRASETARQFDLKAQGRDLARRRFASDIRLKPQEVHLRHD